MVPIVPFVPMKTVPVTGCLPVSFCAASLKLSPYMRAPIGDSSIMTCPAQMATSLQPALKPQLPTMSNYSEITCTIRVRPQHRHFITGFTFRRTPTILKWAGIKFPMCTVAAASKSTLPRCKAVDRTTPLGTINTA